jgi:hypothetical protein
MASVAAPESAPLPEEVLRIAAIRDPIARNLEITYCYHRLSLAFTPRTGQCANWCTFATWASRQAGRTIRGEDIFDAVIANTLTGSVFAHPIRWCWRRLLRRGLLNKETRLGRIVNAIHTPFDALEAASDAVARGNLKVFEEIGYQFARYLQSTTFESFIKELRPGDPPGGQQHLIDAFTIYEMQSASKEEEARAQSIFYANVKIGMHEQIRLQPEIQESLEAAPATAEDLGMRTLQAIYPGAWNWNAFIRRPLAAMLGPAARSFSRHARELTRRAITDSLMTLALPGVTLALGRHLDRSPCSLLAALTNAELKALLAEFEPPAGSADDSGAADWSNLKQRMHFIIHLFRSFHDCVDLLESPFTPEQAAAIRAGRVPR